MKRPQYLFFLIILMLFTTGCGKSRKDSAVEDITPTITIAPSPTITPSPTPVPSPTPIPKVTATILSVGDVIMHDAVIRSGKINDESYDYTRIFQQIKPYVQSADFSILNYEGVSMDTDRNYTGYPLFNAPPAIIAALSDTGFKMVNTGNNHCLDRGLHGLLESRNIIKQHNMQVIGTFRDISEPRSKVLDLKGIKTGFLSYTYGCNMNENRLSEEEQNIHLSLINNEKMKKEITALSKTVDVVVVLMHWGAEYQRQPIEAQKILADHMFQWGADIILGSHPHVVEPSEIREIDGEFKYLMYSMGNFLSNQIGGNNPNPRNNDLTEDGVMISLQLEKDFETEKTRLISVTHIPTWVYRYWENECYQYTIYPVPSLDHESIEGLDDKLVIKLKNSYNRTMDMVQDWSIENDTASESF